MSGQPLDGSRSVQPDPELDPSQNVDDADAPSQERTSEPVSGTNAPTGWALDDDDDLTIDLPAVQVPDEDATAEGSPSEEAPSEAAPSEDDDATASWESLLSGAVSAQDGPVDPTAATPAEPSHVEPEPTDPTDRTESADAEPATTQFAAAEPETVQPVVPEEPLEATSARESDEPSGMESDAEPAPTATAAPAAATPSGPVNAEGLPLRPRNHGRRSAKPAKKSHTLLWAVLAGLLVVLIAVALILFFTLRNHGDKPDQGGSTVESMPTTIQTGSPAAAVRDLGKAFKAGHAKDALDLLQVSALEGSKNSNPLLDDKVYAAAKGRPEALTPSKDSYGVPATDSLTAGVSATLKQGGKEQPVSVRLTRDDADSPWKIATASLPALDVTDGGAAQVSANGVKVKLPGSADDYSTHRLFVLPGDYTIKRGNSKFIDYPKTKAFSASGTALSSDPDSASTDLGTTSLAGSLNKKFKDEAEKSVKSWLSACVASKDLAPKDCPFGVDPDGNQVSTVTWKLDKEPTISFPDLTLANATAEGKNGQVSAEAKTKKDGKDATLEAEMQFEFTGTLKISGDKVDFTYAG